MKSVELFDETLDINSTENYEMALQAGSSGFYFCLLDTLRNKFVLIRTYEPEDGKQFTAENIRDFISRDDFLTRPFRKTRIIYPARKFTIVPAPLFDPSRKEEYLSFNHGSEKENKVFSNKTAEPDAYLIYPVQSALNNVMSEYFGGIHPFIHIVPLFNGIAHSKRGSHGSHVHAHIEKDFFNLVVYSHNQMTLCNAYSYKNLSDILYFIMNAFSRLGLSQDGSIHLSGNINSSDVLFTELSSYIRDVRLSQPSGNFTFSYVFDDLGLHRYLNLFNVFNCG